MLSWLRLPLEGHAFMVSFYEFLVWTLRKKSNIKQNVIVVIPELVESILHREKKMEKQRSEIS